MNEKFLAYRSTYNVCNAERYKPIFDRAMNSSNNLLVSPPPKVGGGQVSLTTLKIQMSDALLYLCRESLEDKDKEKYLLLRARIQFKTRKNGIEIYFKDSYRPPQIEIQELGVGGSNDDDDEPIIVNIANWRTKLQDWISDDSNENKVMVLRNLSLSGTDQLWARELLAGTGWEYNVSDSEIRVMRE